MRWLLYIVLVMVLAGCTDEMRHQNALDEAEAMIVSRPQEALARLNDVEVSALHDSAMMARWALLYGEAMVANNLHAPTDTIINIAISYYDAHAIDAQLQRARMLKDRLTAPAGTAYDADATSLYLQKEREYYTLKERMGRERLVLCALIVLVVAVGVILWQRQRLRLNRLRTDAMMAEVSGLKSQINQRDHECSNMASALSVLLERRFALLDSLCATYYESQGTKAERKAVSERVKAEIEAVRSDDAMLAEMERTVNDCRGGMLSALKEAMPDIRPVDYRLAMYLACGLSYRTIALLMDESVDTLYKRKSRLKGRLKAAQASDIAAMF